MITLLARAHRRAQAVRADGDRGSLVLAMLVMLVATSVAALLLPLLMSSTNAATFDDRRTRQLSAAQSGVQTAIARIRAAADTSSAGLIAALPCATLTGAVLGEAKLRYRVDVQYFTSDPALLRTADQLTAATVTCVAGLGTKVTPSFARITAVGTDVPGTAWTGVASRTVSATYVVKTSNSNIVGGLFRVNKLAGSRDLCLDAGDQPQANTTITMQPCDKARASQKFAYNFNLTVSLVSSRVLDAAGTIVSDGLCVDGGSPQNVGNTLLLQACGTTAAKNQQRWSMNDNAGMQGTDNGSTLNRYCWAVANPDQPSSVVSLGTACAAPNGGYDNIVSWQPEAAVGAGASGATYSELVNYAQFGRCLDVTDQNPNSSYLIAWPCKQHPDPTKVTWNQRWALPTVVGGVGTGQITTTRGPTTYCLTSPLSDRGKKYVTVAACPAAPTPETTWTVRTKVASYAASYQIEDWSGGGAGKGLCLQPTDPTAATPDLFDRGTGISKIVVAACTASTLQKWNAPPNIDAPSVKDQTEN